jgi:hypothetical protein
MLFHAGQPLVQERGMQRVQWSGWVCSSVVTICLMLKSLNTAAAAALRWLS